MRFLPFLEEAPGVRGFLVGNDDGERLHVSGTGLEPVWTSVRAAAIALDFGVAGAIAGLGGFSGAAVRSAQTSRLLAQRGNLVVVIDLELTRTTVDLENELRLQEWQSSKLQESQSIRSRMGEAPQSGASERGTLPPPGPRPGTPETTTASVASSSPGAPPAVRSPPRPFLGMPALSRAVPPRPSGSAPPTAPQSVSTVSSASSRPRRPPLPAGRPSAAGSATVEPVLEVGSAPLAEEEVAQPQDEVTGTTSALLQGNLATFALPDLLEFLRVGQRTGTLVCSAEAGLGAIHIKRGRITGAASPGVPGIGDWLVQRGLLSQEQLHDALRHHTQAGAKTQLGATLVTHRLISHETLQEALVVHVGAVLRKLMTWDKGAFTFNPVSPDAGATSNDIDIDPQAVLLNIFKEIDDSQRA